MQSIKAFVGHSFSEVDKDVVRAFLDHFRVLEGAYPNFAWDHAEEADLKTLSEKVLSKIQGKNVFIGICTARELALEESSLSSGLFNRFLVSRSDLQRKPSDWIIQEIGLAIGREMKLVIFLEDGVRKPGGLFGDAEYISFSRLRPSESFDKFLEILKKLSPINAVLAPEPKPADAETVEKKEESVKTLAEPSTSWTKEDYSDAMFDRIWQKDSAGEEKIGAAFKASIFSQGEGFAEWEGWCEFIRGISGGVENLEKLKKLSEEHPTNSGLLFYTACAYENYKDYSNAAKTFEEAANCAKDDTVLRKLGNAAKQYALADNLPRALEILERIKSVGVGKPELSDVVVDVLEELAELEKDEDLQLALLEKKVSTKPGDSKALFAAAFKHSESDNGDMALHHYNKIPAAARDSATWNNLGVCFGQIEMPVEEVRAFRKSAEQNEPLAMSNLGFKFISEGFYDEAKAEFDKAIKIEGYHKNVPLLATRLHEIADEERKKLEEALKQVRLKALFYRQFGDAVVLPTPTKVASKWQSPDCEMVATLKGTALKLSGSYQRPASPLGLALLGSSPGMLAQTTLQKVEYNGRLHGQIVIAKVTKKSEGDTVLGIGSNDGKALMYFSPDGAEIHVMESPHSANPNFLVLKRIS